MSRRILLTSFLMLFFFILGNHLVSAQIAPPVVLNILNEDPKPETIEIEVVRGDPVEVGFVVEPGADSSPDDVIQLLRVNDSSIVDEKFRGESLSGAVSLDTNPASALDVLVVAYISSASGFVLGLSDEQVTVVDDTPPEPPTSLKFPGDAPTIQDAVDALADGGTLTIAEGVYEINDTIFIENKMINIEGKGANCNDLLTEEMRGKEKRDKPESLGTVLIGPIPDTVGEGTTYGPMFKFSNAGGSLSGVKTIGFDSGIEIRESPEGGSKALDVSDTCITETRRGIYSKSGSPLKVTDTILANISLNGVSISPERLKPEIVHAIKDTKLYNITRICVYVNNSSAHIEDDYLTNCMGGGIVAFKSAITVLDNTLVNSTKAGIMVQDSLGILQENTILGTKARIDGTFGDAVVAWDDSSVIMVDNHTHDTARAAVSNFGAYVSLESNQFLCQGFDLQGEPYSGDDFTFDDFGDNWCGCGAPQGPCQVISSQVGPPPPVGGLE